MGIDTCSGEKHLVFRITLTQTIKKPPGNYREAF
jgi:hypothetical protein